MSPARCGKVRGLLSAFIDGELSPPSRLMVENHLAGCPACSAEMESLRTVVAMARNMPRPELPADFHAGLVRRIRAEAPAVARAVPGSHAAASVARLLDGLGEWFRRLPTRRLAYAAAALLIFVWAGSFAYFMGVPIPGADLLGLRSPGQEGSAPQGMGGAGIGAEPGAPPGATGYSGDFAATDKAPGGDTGGYSIATDEGGRGGSGEDLGAAGAGAGSEAVTLAAGAETGRKVILHVFMNLECENIAEAKDKAIAASSSAGGFVESLSYWTDQAGVTGASLTLRVPTDSLYSVLERIRLLGSRVVTEQISRQDVTARHIDLSAHVRNLKLQEQRLLLLLGQAQNLGEMFAIENELARVRTEIESYEAQLRALDEQIALSTIVLNLQPVQPGPGPEAGLWDRIVDAFFKSLEWLAGVAGGFVVFLAAIAVPLVVFAGLVWFVVLAVQARRRRRAGM